MLNRQDLISYAMDFSSYLIRNTEKIDKIILHGSISRGDFDKNSDIDIFIDSSNKNAEREIKKIEDNFYKTDIYKKWKLKGEVNEISLIIGRLDNEEWKDLKRAIISTGILLYGKYNSNIQNMNNYVLFVFENIKPESKRVFIHRKLFGFKTGKKKYSGLIEEIKGIKIGKNSILVNSEHAKKIKDLLKSKKITPKIYDIWME